MRPLKTLFAFLFSGALIAVPVSASASACFAVTGVQPPSPGSADNYLNGAAVLPPSCGSAPAPECIARILKWAPLRASNAFLAKSLRATALS